MQGSLHVRAAQGPRCQGHKKGRSRRLLPPHPRAGQAPQWNLCSHPARTSEDLARPLPQPLWTEPPWLNPQGVGRDEPGMVLGPCAPIWASPQPHPLRACGTWSPTAKPQGKGAGAAQSLREAVLSLGEGVQAAAGPGAVLGGRLRMAAQRVRPRPCSVLEDMVQSQPEPHGGTRNSPSLRAGDCIDLSFGDRGLPAAQCCGPALSWSLLFPSLADGTVRGRDTQVRSSPVVSPSPTTYACPLSSVRHPLPVCV